MQGKRPDLDQRIQNAVFGLPLVRPDEQHRCLGTFMNVLSCEFRLLKR